MGTCTHQSEKRHIGPPYFSSRIKQTRPSTEQQMIRSVQQIFIENDLDRDGYLDAFDIKRMHRKMSSRHIHNRSIKVLSEDEYVRKFFLKADLDGDNLIS